MHTATKGNAAEAGVLEAFLGRGWDVLVPFGEGHPYDLVAYRAPSAFLRIQCKAARLDNRCLSFNSRATDHGRGRLAYLGRADIFGVYSPDAHGVYLVPIREVKTFVVRLRLGKPRNNQRRGIRLAADYAIDRWTPAMLMEEAAAAMSATPRRSLAYSS
jgi:hypothetical protein